MSNSNINTIYVEASIINIYAKFQLHPLMASEKKIFNIYFENLAFWLPWPLVKISNLDKIHMVGRGVLQERFCKPLSKYLQ